jgi:hypothetical protein
MQTTLRIDERIYRAAKAEAARLGVTITRFIEDSLRQRIASAESGNALPPEVEERNKLMEALLLRTAGFLRGSKPSRNEMNER